jgi:competence protein ComEC
VKLLDPEMPILQMQIGGKTWLLIGINPDEQTKLALSKKLPQAQVLLWSGKALAPDLIKAVQPKVAIASSPILDRNTMSSLRQSKAKVFVTGRDGAIQWTPNGEFEATIEITENKASIANLQ